MNVTLSTTHTPKKTANTGKVLPTKKKIEKSISDTLNLNPITILFKLFKSHV